MSTESKRRRGQRRGFTVEEIRAIRASTEYDRVLGERYGVCRNTISAIRRYDLYPHIDPLKKPEKRPRMNHRGEVWCFRCRKYLPADRFNYVQYPSMKRPRYWYRCKDCTMKAEYERPRNQPGTEAWKRAVQQNLELRRKRRAKERRERNDLVRRAIPVLRQRGFTKSEICKLAGVSFGDVLKYESGEFGPRGVRKSVAERFAIVLRETADYRAQPEPAYRRRTPHPDLPSLLARITPQIEPYLHSRSPHRRLEIAA